MRRTVCIDLDGTLASYKEGWKGLEHFGDPIPGAVEFTKRVAEFADIIIFTCRGTEEMSGRNGWKAPILRKLIQEYLDKHGFAYHDIFVGQGKPIASAYVDDRAIKCDPENDGYWTYDVALKYVKELCDVEQDAGERPPGDTIAKPLSEALLLMKQVLSKSSGFHSAWEMDMDFDGEEAHRKLCELLGVKES